MVLLSTIFFFIFFMIIIDWNTYINRFDPVSLSSIPSSWSLSLDLILTSINISLFLCPPFFYIMVYLYRYMMLNIIYFSFSIQNDGSMTPSMYMAPMTWSQTKFKQINLQIIDKSWEDLPNEIFCVRDQKTIIILIFVLLRK